MRHALRDKMNDFLFHQLWLAKLSAQIYGSLASIEGLPLKHQTSIDDSAFETIRQTTSITTPASSNPEAIEHIELYRGNGTALGSESARWSTVI